MARSIGCTFSVTRVLRRLLVAAAACAAISVAAPPPAHAADVLRFGTSVRPTLGAATFYAAMEGGFFRDQGIDLQWIFLDGDNVMLPQLALKRIDVAWVSPASVIVSHDTGKDPYPATFFYNWGHRTNWEVVVPAESSVRSLADLKGKAIGVLAPGAGNIPITKAALRRAGLDPERDVSYVTIGAGPNSFVAVRNDQVQASNLFDLIHAQMQLSGIALRKLPFPSDLEATPGYSFAAHPDTLRDRPDLMARFGRAVAMGMLACDLNPEGCVRMTWRAYPATQPTSGDPAKNLADAVAMLRNNTAYKIPPGTGCQRDWGWGYVQPTAWASLVSVLADSGLITRRDMDPTTMYTNALVPQFGAFDCEAVMARAKELH